MSKEIKTISIRMTVFGVFIVVAGLTAGLVLGLQYFFSLDLAKTAAANAFRSTSKKVGERIQDLDRQSANLVEILVHFPGLETFPTTEQERRSLPLLAGSMAQNTSLYAIYVGYDSGAFFELVNLESSDSVRKAYQAAPHDRWVVVKVVSEGGAQKKIIHYLDSDFNVRIETQVATDYDPRKRPWFKEATTSPGIIKTAPYIFANLNAPGVTYAKAMNDGQWVVAVDISLAGLSSFLQKQRAFPHTHSFLFDEKGDIIARTLENEKGSRQKKPVSLSLTGDERAFIFANPVIRASNETDWPPFDFAMSGKPKGYSVDLLNLLAEKAGLRIKYINGYSWENLVELYKKGDIDLLHSLLKTPERQKMGIFTTSYWPMPQAFVVKSATALPSAMADLKGRTVAIPKGWATDAFLENNHPEVKRLYVANTLEAMRAVSTGEADATLDCEPVLRYLAASYFLEDLKIGGYPFGLVGGKGAGLHFLARPEKAHLASILEKSMAAVTPEEKAWLEDKWFKKGSLENQSLAASVTVPHKRMLELASKAGPEGDLQTMTIQGREYLGYVNRIKTVYGADEFLGLLVPQKELLAPYMEKVRFSLLATLGMLVFLAPIVRYCATIIVKPINALALENEKVRQRNYNEVGLVKSNITEILGLSRSMVSMASAIKSYEESLKELMDSFIKVIAAAIDHKSPYTGGHCARVPELSIMLAKAAEECAQGPLVDFHLETEDDWHEFRTAAWLHDCGKVTTPEYVVDKSTKLETIYNRIHEVRMRFEILLRDAEIEYWKGLSKGGDPKELFRILNARQQKISDDFSFIAECNVGGESMSDEKIGRMREISKKTWVRHLDDRLGLGHLELSRYSETAPNLPCEEPLLADRPEHIIRRTGETALGNTDARFAMEIPEQLYNLGEIYNLSISRGTLTAEDRYKIQEHIITTIQMLEKLPYPENMTRIPEYAGGHHETLIGTGYPRKLFAQEISIPARIIAVADIFEALTASDRPYKKAKKLSEALQILTRMVKRKHLDADLFRVFLESGVYMEYAKRFLDPTQIDDVNVEAALAQLNTTSK